VADSLETTLIVDLIAAGVVPLVHQEDHLHVRMEVAFQEVAFQEVAFPEEVLLFRIQVAAFQEVVCPVVAYPGEEAYLFHSSLGVPVVVPCLRRNLEDLMHPSAIRPVHRTSGVEPRRAAALLLEQGLQRP